MTETPRTIKATAAREGKWWMISFAELDTVTQARRISEIQEMADDCAALWLDVDASVIDVCVTIEIPETFSTDGESAQTKTAQARAVETEAAALS